MGISKHILAASAAAVLMTGNAGAAPVQATQDADGRALILVPLTLTKIDDLDFGGVVPSNVSGVVTVNASTGVRSFSGGVFGVASDAGNRAHFAGAGSPDQQVIVSIDAPVELVSAGGDVIPVLALTQDGSAIRTIDPVTRAFYVYVGGSIEIAADQPEGEYSADFTVYANYQ